MYSPGDVTASDMVTDASEVHSLKAYSPSDVTLSGMVTDASEVHVLKAYLPMVVSLLENDTLERALQP